MSSAPTFPSFTLLVWGHGERGMSNCHSCFLFSILTGLSMGFRSSYYWRGLLAAGLALTVGCVVV